MSNDRIRELGERILAGTQASQIGNNASLPPPPILQQLDPSFLSTVGAYHILSQDKNKPINVLIQGPSQSGKSSLAMEFALEMASKSPCRCHQPHECLCQPVLFVRPRTEEEDETFPLRCRRCGEIEDQDPDELPASERIQRLKRQYATNQNSWDDPLLEKISIFHVESLRDGFLYFLSLPSLPEHEQPYGAIVLDGIDALSQGSLELHQFAAILFDTVRFLKPRPPICMTMLDHHQQPILFPMDCYMASFFDSILTIHPNSDRAASWNKACEENSVAVESSWSVKLSSKHKTGKDKEEQEQKQHEYIVARSGNENYRILWRVAALEPPLP